MATHSIAVIGGDGVGPEVTAEAKKVLQAMSRRPGAPQFRFTEYPWGSNYYRETGRMMPEDGLDQLRNSDAMLVGAVGDPSIPDHITLNGLLLPIRRRFDQGVCYRPAYLYEGVPSPLAGKKPGDIDLVTFRENTEGEYANIGGHLYEDTESEVAVQTSVMTYRGTERIIRAAFEYASRPERRGKVTSVTKSNAQGFSMVFWDRVFKKVAAEFPRIETESLLVDRACMDFVRRPESFDVVVASNLFGDILTDIGAIITGSMGLAPSANIDPERRYPSMFEPVHGAAFDIMGKGIANPLGAILAAGMMLEHLEWREGADAIQAAVKLNLREARVRTPDLGGSASTSQVGDEIARLVAG